MNQQAELKTIRRQIDSEEDLQAYMELGMEQYGWTVLREVSARDNNCRADIVAKNEEIGAIGIECKYVTGGPIVAAEAARQIFEKYASEKFFQWNIDAWGVCLFGRAFTPEDMKPDKEEYKRESYYHSSRGRDKGQIATTQRILNGLGIGFVNPWEDRVVMEFLPSDWALRVPLFHVNGEMPQKYTDKVDMERVAELIDERRP